MQHLLAIINGRLAFVQAIISGHLWLCVATHILRKKWGELREQEMLARAWIIAADLYNMSLADPNMRVC